MKKLIILFLFATQVAFAQEPTSSAGKQSFKTLTASLEKLKTMDPSKGTFGFQTEVDKAQKKIDALQKSDPTFNVSSYQKQVDEYKAKLSSFSKGKAEASANDDASKDKAYVLDEEMKTIFRAPYIEEFYNLGSEISAFDKIIADYKLAVNNYLATNPPERIADAERVLRFNFPKSLSEELHEYNVRADELKRIAEKGQVESEMLASFYTLKKYEIYWDAGAKSFPGDARYTDNLAYTTKVLSTLGSIDKVKGNSKSNKAASLNSVKMDKALRKDAATENLFKQAFTAEGWNETILAVNLLDSDWRIRKNNLTGAIIGRYQTACIAAKNKNGECIKYTFSIIQEYNGSGYQTYARRDGHNAAYMNCDNAK